MMEKNGTDCGNNTNALKERMRTRFRLYKESVIYMQLVLFRTSIYRLGQSKPCNHHHMCATRGGLLRSVLEFQSARLLR